MLYTTFVIILDCVHILFRFFFKKFSGLFFLCHDSKFLLEHLLDITDSAGSWEFKDVYIFASLSRS